MPASVRWISAKQTSEPRTEDGVQQLGLARTGSAAASDTEPAVALNEQRVHDEVFTISCQAPGPHTITFENEIEPADPLDTDPNLANNSASESFVVECVVPVAINIKPGSDPNSINIRNNGVIPVAVLTTEAGECGLPLAFDATTIDPLSVRFGPEAVVQSGGGATETHGRGHLEDSLELDETTRDGDLDMVSTSARRRPD